MVKYELDENIVGLAKILSIGIIVMLVLAIFFDFLGTILTDGYSLQLEIWGLIATIASFLASLAALFGLLILLSKDDSNFIRVIAIIYAASLILTILFKL